MQLRNTIVTAALLAASGNALAAKPGTPTLADIFDASGISVSGYVDTSYTYNTDSGYFVGGTPSRTYDYERNSFNFNMLDLTLSSLPKQGFGALVDLNAGSDARIDSVASGNNDQFDVQQGYVNYASGPFGVMMGKFVTLAGAEVIKSPDNMNFSRSFLFGLAIPFTHTGVRSSYTVSDSLKFTVGLNNGWDTVRDSQADAGKTLELGVAFNPTKDLATSVAIYHGRETSAFGPNGMRTLVDGVASMDFSNALTGALNIDIAEQTDAMGPGRDAQWRGFAAYGGYKFSPMWRAAVRAEYFNDVDGFRTGTGTPNKLTELTGTVAFMPVKAVELRGEVRMDRSNKDVFRNTGGAGNKTQATAALEALYKF